MPSVTTTDPLQLTVPNYDPVDEKEHAENIRAVDKAVNEIKNYTCPIGSMMAYAGSTAPSFWLLCYGQAISRTEYEKLFAVIGTTYGVGDGSTTFNLPDLRGRVVVSLDNMGGTDATRLSVTNTLGGSGGEETHLNTSAESGIVAHSHTITEPNSGQGHRHLIDRDTDAASGTAKSRAVETGTGTGASVHTDRQTTGITIDNATAANAASAHNNMQPYILLNYIIKF